MNGPLRRLQGFAPLGILLLIWVAAAQVLGPGVLPGPARTAALLASSAFHNELLAAQGGGAGGYLPHVWSTFWNVVLATSAGVLAGLFIALAAMQFPFARAAANTFTEWGRTLPPLLFVPFAAAGLGASDLVRFISISFYSGLTVIVYGMNAFTLIPDQYQAMAELLGASRARRILTVQVPAMLPHLAGPIRLIFAFALGISIVAEYLAAGSGIGRAMREFMAYARADLILVGVVWTLLLALLLDAGLVLLLAMAMRWTNRRTLLEWLAR